MENKKRQKKLSDLIKKYDEAYYKSGHSLISDFEYDKLYREFKELENSNRESTKNSPTTMVGNDLTRGFKKVKHSNPMMSIDNTYSQEELTAWLTRTKKTVNDENCEFVCELKMDGVAAAVRFDNGVLSTAITRGNGTLGDDITENAKTIKSLPKEVSRKDSFEIRGEIFMNFENFEKLNTALIQAGQAPMQNPRNTAAGTIKLLDSKEVAKRGLNFMAHSESEIKKDSTHLITLNGLDKLNISVVPHSEALSKVSDILEFVEKWEPSKNNIGFPVDGIVIKVNSGRYREMLGSTAKSPRWIIAYKYKPETAITEVIAIDTQVGRTGIITPVARLKPVLLSGSTISNATLHNFDEIDRLGVKVGDLVEIEKSGEIIPKILKVVEPSNSPNVKIPTHCISCNSELIKLKDEVALRCMNSKCPAKLQASISYFVSRNAYNIDGLGPSIIELLIKESLILSASDIFYLKKEDLLKIERMGEKSVDNLLRNIENSKSAPLHSLITALGVPLLGAQSAKALVTILQDISDLYTIDKEQLLQIDGIGEIMADSIIKFFASPDNQNIITRMQDAGVNMRGEKGNIIENNRPLKNQKIVLTGTLEEYKRAELSKLLEDRGAKIVSSVSKNTTLIIAGENAGSKLTKGQNLGIKIISESEIAQLLN